MAFNAGNISKADAAAYSSSDSDSNDDNVHLQAPSGDPRADEFGDFNPRKRRRTGRNAKESAALGIFGSDSDDDHHAGTRWAKNGKGKKNLRHSNMSFVSAGLQNATKSTGEEEEDEDEDEGEDGEYAEVGKFGIGARMGTAQAGVNGIDEDDDDDEDEDGAAGVGLGFKPAGLGLGWTPPTQTDAPVVRKPTTKPKYDGTTPLGRGFVPSSANEPVLKAGLRDAPSPAPTPKPSAFGGGGGKKSFAAKMMAKMGYVEGQGLGAEGQGRNVIIEATLRPQGVGLGAVKEKSKQEREEEKRQARKRGEEVIDSDEEEKRKKRERRKKALDSGASASGGSTPRRPKTKYLTVSDIEKAAPGLKIPEAFAPILDLTDSAGQKLITPGSGLMTPTSSTELTEQTEARKLAGRAQRDLSAFVEEWRTLEERKAWLDMQKHQLFQESEQLEGDFHGLEGVASIFQEISAAAREKEWDPVLAGLKKIQATGVVDEDVADVAVAAIHPFLRDDTQFWQVLDDPKLGHFAKDLTEIEDVLGLKKKTKVIAKWDELDIDGTHRHHQKSMQPYESMIYKYMFPKISTAINQQWDSHDPTPLSKVFDSWDSLLPPFVRNGLLDQVVRRLESAITKWRPKQLSGALNKPADLPHLWIFPWLQYLPSHHLDPKANGVVADVRRKYRQVIDTWAFDRGVIPGLKQWKDVFRPSKTQDQWKPLVMHHILPSMAKYLRTNFRVDPSDQEPYVPMLDGVLEWVDLIAPSMIAEVIVAEIFPMWHDVLHQWLTSGQADYGQIGDWFEWWQDTALAVLTAQSSILAEFQRGAAMIDRALDLGDDASQLPKPDQGPAHLPKARPSKPSAEAPAPPVLLPEQPERSFRDDIEEWCIENDLRFIPMPKSTDQGERYHRMTARMDGKGGLLAFFRKGEDILIVENRKAKSDFQLHKDNVEARDKVLSTLYQEVE